MAIELRKTGISIVADAPWGTHFCHFYDTKQDLLDTLVPYFKAGLESNEYCLWVVSDSDLITVEEAKRALALAVPDLNQHISDENIEILKGHEWYFEQRALNLERAKHGWDAKLKRALMRGFEGLRASADTFWLAENDWKDFFAYEKQVNDWITNQSMTVMCTYPLAKSRATEVLDVVQAHQFAIARRQGEWEVVETPQLVQAKAEIKRLNEELEQRVVERTNELRVANEELKKEIAERQQAEALLFAKEQEFRGIVENAPDQIIRYDRELRRVYVNPAVAEAYGLPAEALTGTPMGSVIQDAGVEVEEDELTRLRQRIEAVFNTGKSSEFEITWPLPTGRKSFSIRAFPELDVDGSVINVLGIARDITERRLAEDELRQQKEILQQIFDHLPVMISFVDGDGRLKLVNREWERTLGWSLEEIRQQNLDIFAECYPDPQYRQDVLKFVAEAKGRSVDFKTRVRDGRVIDTSFVRVQLSDGTSIGIGQDITERKQVGTRLRQSEERFRQLAESITEVFWMTEPDKQQVLYVSPGYEKIWGRPCETVYEHPTTWIDAIHPDDRSRIEKAATTLQVLGRYDEEYRIIRPDGSIRWIRDRAFPIHDSSGRVYRLTGIAEDITERKLADEKLKATSEQLRALSASLQSAREEEGARIARELHDELGSALTSLRWSLDEIDKLLSKTNKDAADTLRGKIATMITLVASTLNTVRRISSELRPGILDDVGLIAAIKWEIRQFQTRSGIVCYVDSLVEEAHLTRDQSTAIFRIFQEALTNVLRHAQSTRVDITIKEEEEGEFVLTIRDNGRGITDEEKAGEKSLGLLGMRERAHLIGGEVNITGSARQGTVVTVRVAHAEITNL